MLLQIPTKRNEIKQDDFFDNLNNYHTILQFLELYFNFTVRLQFKNQAIYKKNMASNSHTTQLQKKTFKKSVFELIFICNENQTMKKQINLIGFVLNIITNLLVFLSFDSCNIINSTALQLPLLGNIVLGSIYGFFLLQFVVGVVYKFQFMITNQLKFIRFLLYPLFGRYFLQQAITNGSVLYFLVFTTIFASLLIFTILFISQTYNDTQIYSQNCPLSPLLLIMETLLYSLQALQAMDNDVWKVVISGIIFFGCTSIRLKYFTKMSNYSLQFRILSINNFLFLIYSTTLLFQSFIKLQSFQSIILMSALAIVYRVYAQFVRRKIIPSNFSQIFKVDKLTFEHFMKHCSYIVDEIDQFKQPNHPSICESILFTFFFEHQKHCTMVNCHLKGQNNIQQFKDMTNQKNLSKIIAKILRKIEILFEQVCKNQPDNTDLKISYIKFYTHLLPNKIKILELISEVQQHNLSIKAEYELQKYKKIADNMDSAEVIDNLKKDDVVNEFQKTAFSTVNSMTQFWKLFNQEKIDLQKVIKVSSRVLSLKKKFHRQWQRSMKQEKFSTLKIVILYAHFLKYVLYDHQTASNLQYFAKTLQQKLNHKKQIKYLSYGSQSGLIGASLTDNNLGRIVIANSQASNIFGYSRNQINKIRLNDIMPKIFAQQHDNYMAQFYKNRHKKVNSDQRLLVGKDKFGFVILIMLQLQRTIGTLLNDQLLFIANIKKFKAKQSPIVCITDQEGEINDMSAPFRQIFFQHKEKKKPLQLNKNIQEIIPQFFDTSRDSSLKNAFTEQIQSEKCGRLIINFTVIPMCFPLKPKGGYIIIGNRHKKPFQNSKVDCFNATKDIQYKIDSKVYQAQKVFYNPQKNVFEFDSKKTKALPQSCFKEQFYTIPFINLNDLTNIFKMKNDSKDFGEGIRTLRLVDSHHLIRVQDLETFQSQCLLQEQKKQTFDLKLKKMKDDQLLSDQCQRSLKFGKLSILLICSTLVILSILMIFSINTYQQTNKSNLLEAQFKYNVRGQVPQYILSFEALSNSFNNSYYQEKVSQVTNSLLNVIESSNIQQSQKQQILKIFYLKKNSDLISFLNSETILFCYEEVAPLAEVFSTWVAIQTLLVVFCLVLTLAVLKYWSRISQIFDVFLAIEEKLIKKICTECEAFQKLIKQSNGQNLSSKKPKNQDQNDETNQNPVHRRRQYKEGSQKKSRAFLLKLFAPIIVLLILSAVLFIYINLKTSNFQYQFKLRNQIFSTYSESSVAIMNKYFDSYKNQTYRIQENFQNSYQFLQKQVFNYQLDTSLSSSPTSSLFLSLLADACKSGQFVYSPSIQSICNDFDYGIMQNGLSIVINEISSEMKDLNLNNSYSYGDQFTDIYMLQYQFSAPLIKKMINTVQSKLLSDLSSFIKTSNGLLTLLICLVILNSFYISQYMFQVMKRQIQQKKQLLTLIPNLKQQTKSKSQQDTTNKQIQIKEENSNNKSVSKRLTN